MAIPDPSAFTGSAVTESGFKDALTQLIQAVVGKDYVDTNPLFVPVSLTTETITNIVKPGNYLQGSSANATIARGYPEQITGKLTVIGVGNYVFYTYETTTQNRYSGVLSGGSFSGWTLTGSATFFTYKGLLGTVDLNTCKTQGWQLQNNTANITTGLNYPVSKAGRLDIYTVPTTSIVYHIYTTTDNEIYRRVFNGTSWTLWILGANKTDTDTALASTLNQAKSYADTGAAALFKKETTTMFPEANLVVRRYLTTGTSNDYAAGTYQIVSENGLQVTVTPSGSNAIRHYLKTGLTGYKSVVATFKISQVRVAASGEGVGVGYIDGSGNYTAYIFTESGNVTKLVNHTATILKSGLTGYLANDVVKVSIDGTILTVLLNDTSIYTVAIAEISGEILLGQSGFTVFIASMMLSSDPIRNYVKDQVSNIATVNRSPCYYSFNPTGGVSGAGLLMAYSQIKDDRYVGFEIVHEVDNSELVYKDYWRIFRAKIYTLTSGAMVDTGLFALAEGESEFVFKQNASKDDFTGGYHGDEKVTSLTVMIDGVPIVLTAGIVLTAAKQVEYVEKSTMHATAEGGIVITGHPKVADHIKRTVIKNGGYSTFSRVIWNIATTISTVYHGISCVSKDVASAAFTDGSFTEQAMTGANTLYFNEAGARAISYYNSSGYAAQATAKIIKPAAEDVNATLFVNDRPADTKYYRQSPVKTVAIGEVWESEFSCQFLKL